MKLSPPSGLRTSLLACAIVCGALLAGCKDKGPPTGNVTGRITFNAQPVSAGTVVFENPSQAWIAAGDLDGGGLYRLTDVRVGEYVVSIQPPAAKTPNESDASLDEIKAGLGRKTPDPANIPRPMRSTQSSPLKGNVVEGNQELHFDLAKPTGP